MRRNVILTLVLLVALLSLTVYFVLRDKDSRKEIGTTVVDEKGVVRQDPSNATFTIEGESVKLSGGRNETSVAPGSSFMEETSILDKFAYGDLNGDNKEDTVLLLARYGAGSGTFVYLATFVSGTVTYRGSNAVFLGDRISPESITVSAGTITVRYLDREPDEPMAAEPTVSVTRQFVYINGELQEK